MSSISPTVIFTVNDLSRWAWTAWLVFRKSTISPTVTGSLTTWPEKSGSFCSSSRTAPRVVSPTGFSRRPIEGSARIRMTSPAVMDFTMTSSRFSATTGLSSLSRISPTVTVPPISLPFMPESVFQTEVMGSSLYPLWAARARMP